LGFAPAKAALKMFVKLTQGVLSFKSISLETILLDKIYPKKEKLTQL
jgi:hypothetical protein